MPKQRVVVVCLEGTVAFDAAVVCQIFAPADGEGAGFYEVTLCGPRRSVATPHGFNLQLRAGIEALDAADFVVIAGTEPPRPHLPSAWRRGLLLAHERNARMASICTGAFVLADLGLLDGKQATTHWRHADRLQRDFPAIEVRPEVLYVDDGQVATSAGLAAGLDLCLHMVREHRGAEVAAATARETVIAPHREGGQAQFLQRPIVAGDESTTSRTRTWALERLDERLTIDDLATHAHMSRRSFTRHFSAETGVSPAAWLLARRVEHAQRLLETTHLPISQVARRSGFSGQAALRKSFMGLVGVTPSAYRRTFASP